MFLHLGLNCVEVCSYNNHSATEYNRLYFDRALIFRYVGDAALKRAIEEKQQSMAEENLALSEAAIVEEEERQLVSSHLIQRLELNVGTPEEPAKRTISYRFSPSLTNPTVDLASPLLPDKPPELTPVLVPRRRLSSAEEIESVIQNIASIEASLQSTTQAAATLVDRMIDSNSKLLGRGAGCAATGVNTSSSAVDTPSEVLPPDEPRELTV